MDVRRMLATCHCRNVIHRIQMHALNPIWNTLPDIEAYFDNGIPSGPIRLDSVTVVVDSVEFVSGHIATAKAHHGQRLFVPYVERLAKLKEICQR